MQVGLAIQLKDIDIEPQLRFAAESGFDMVQIAIWNMEKLCPDGAKWLKNLLDKYGLKLSELWCGWQKPAIWDFKRGPSVLGLVPPEYRYARLQSLLMAGKCAEILGVSDVISHLGFLPVNPCDLNYIGVVEAMRYLLEDYQERGLYFSLETGQETPTIARRLIEDIDSDHMGVNYDPANLILYGNGNPIDGINILKPYIRSVHVKNGCSPKSGYLLGEETSLECGEMDIEKFLTVLSNSNFDRVLTIENEMKCSSQERRNHIIRAKMICEDFIKNRKVF